MVLYLAVIKAGGIAVLCNPGYTEAELSHALHLTEPHIVIGPRTLCKRIFDHYSISHEAPPSFVATDPDGSIDDDYTNFWQLSNPISMSMAQEYFAKKYSLYHHDWTKTATMAFSSGTSGMPKAVELSHKALVSLYLAAKPTGCYDMSRQERSFIPIPTYHVGGLAFWLQTCIKGDHSIFFENNPFSLETFADVCIEWKIQVSNTSTPE
jgi:4-coumarate--CoA ligase